MASRIGRQRAGAWWRGHELVAIVVVFWFAVIGLWLALLLGAQTTGVVVPHNPLVADWELLLGHMKWPGNWSTALIVLEVAFLAVLIRVARGIILDRIKSSTSAS